MLYLAIISNTSTFPSISAFTAPFVRVVVKNELSISVEESSLPFLLYWLNFTPLLGLTSSNIV